MFEFLKLQYKMGKITEENLKNLIGKRITQDEFNFIIDVTVGGINNG